MSTTICLHPDKCGVTSHIDGSEAQKNCGKTNLATPSVNPDLVSNAPPKEEVRGYPFPHALTEVIADTELNGIPVRFYSTATNDAPLSGEGRIKGAILDHRGNVIQFSSKENPVEPLEYYSDTGETYLSSDFAIEMEDYGHGFSRYREIDYDLTDDELETMIDIDGITATFGVYYAEETYGPTPGALNTEQVSDIFAEKLAEFRGD